MANVQTGTARTGAIGGIQTNGGTINLINVNVRNPHGNMGSAISATGGSVVTIADSRFSNNNPTLFNPDQGNRGVIYTVDSELTISNSIFQGHRTPGTFTHGGVLHTVSSEVKISGSFFGCNEVNCPDPRVCPHNKSNLAGQNSQGGAAYFLESDVIILDTTIRLNHAPSGGGAIRAVGGSLVIGSGTRILDNIGRITGGVNQDGGILISAGTNISFHLNVVLENNGRPNLPNTFNTRDCIAEGMWFDTPVPEIDGDADIEITPPTESFDPFLLDPTGIVARELFGAYLGDRGLTFGTWPYTGRPQTVMSENELSVVYGYLDRFNEMFEVTVSISDFLVAGTNNPIFSRFALELIVVGYGDCGNPELGTNDYIKAEPSNVTLTAGALPTQAFSSNYIGHGFATYEGELTFAQDRPVIGRANATITWVIGYEVQP